MKLVMILLTCCLLFVPAVNAADLSACAASGECYNVVPALESNDA